MTEEKISEKIDEVTKKATEDLNQDLLDKILQGKDFEFEIKGIQYKVRKPTFVDKQKVYKEKIKKYTELLKDENLMLETDLKEQYKKRGIDIDDIQNKIMNLEQEKKSYQLKLGDILIGNGVESDAEIYKKQIEDIIRKQKELSMKKTSLMEYCLEQQLVVFLYAYLTTLIVDKKVGEKWEKVWNSYEEFEASPDEEIINKIAFYSTLMMQEEIRL